MAPRRKVAVKRITALKPFVSNPYNQELIAAHHDAVAAALWLAGMATPEPAAAPSPRLRVLCVLDGVEADNKVLHYFDNVTGRFEDKAECEEDEARCASLWRTADEAKRRRALAERKLAARLAPIQIAGVDLDIAEEDGPIDDVHGEVKVSRKWMRIADYDLVFLDDEMASVRDLAAELPPSRVAFVANVRAERSDGEGQRRRQVMPATLTAIMRRIGDIVTDRRRQLVMPWGTEIACPPAPSADDAAVDEAIVRFAQS